MDNQEENKILVEITHALNKYLQKKGLMTSLKESNVDGWSVPFGIRSQNNIEKWGDKILTIKFNKPLWGEVFITNSKICFLEVEIVALSHPNAFNIVINWFKNLQSRIK